MNCYWCNTELIIGGDIDIEDGMNGYPEFSVMTNLSCPKCFSEVEVLKKRDAFDWNKRSLRSKNKAVGSSNTNIRFNL